MKIDFNTYKDKVMGCWAGKNVGGVLGGPLEGKRKFNEVDFYVQDLSAGPPPNDDLDLQLVWLTAVERFGRQVDASILGEYWLSYIVPNWVEYGTGKANLANGLMPPVSGHFNNRYANSCGCFIRSEIWACLAPGLPDLAVRYAYEDAIVDHSGEGMYGELFCAALESAAFVESDARKLIDIGLSYIPDNCAVARCVKKAVECYNGKLPLTEARVLIHNEAPGTFGAYGQKIPNIPTEGGKLAVGDPGFDCPENVGFLIAGWLYGEGDFGKSLCSAVACGEDTDCTAATLGSILGIISGAKKIPEKWTDPLGDKIATLCINLTWGGVWVPKTVTELTDRVLRITPLFLGIEHCDILAEGGYVINCKDADELSCQNEDDYLVGYTADYNPRGLYPGELAHLGPHTTWYSFPTHHVLVDCGKDIYYYPGSGRKFTVTLINNNIMNQQTWCKLRVYAPDSITFIKGPAYEMQLNTLRGDRGVYTFEFDAGDYSESRLEILLDISFTGRHTCTPVKITMLKGPG